MRKDHLRAYYLVGEGESLPAVLRQRRRLYIGGPVCRDGRHLLQSHNEHVSRSIARTIIVFISDDDDGVLGFEPRLHGPT